MLTAKKESELIKFYLKHRKKEAIMRLYEMYTPGYMAEISEHFNGIEKFELENILGFLITKK
jgi:hypothetical protein